MSNYVLRYTLKLILYMRLWINSQHKWTAKLVLYRVCFIILQICITSIPCNFRRAFVCCRWQRVTEQQDGVTYDGSERVFAVKTFHSSGGCVATKRQKCRKISGHVAPARSTICRIVKRAKGRNRGVSSRTEQTVGAAREAITRRLVLQVGLPSGTALEICRFHTKWSWYNHCPKME
jgi:hypothetical protein